VLAERGGTQLKTPRPVVLVDTREQNPFDFSRFDGWFAGIEKKPLKLGDYSVAGLEESCVVERKGLPDLIRSFDAERSIFSGDPTSQRIATERLPRPNTFSAVRLAASRFKSATAIS